MAALSPKIQTLWVPSSYRSESIYASLSGLQEMQKSIQELFLNHLPRKTLSPHELDDLVKLLEESVTYIDICSKLRDAIMSVKQSAREVQSALRRRGKVSGDLGTYKILKSYIFTRRNTEKEIRKSLTRLIHAQDNIKKVRIFPLMEDFHEHNRTEFLREASVMTSFFLRSIVLYFLVPVSLKMKCSRKWLLVSKFLQKGSVKSEVKKRVDYLSELKEVEVKLSHLLCSKNGEDRIQSVQRELEAVDSIFECLENGVDKSFRGLIKTRASLLNIVSDQ